jgi:hypothetical protein
MTGVTPGQAERERFAAKMEMLADWFDADDFAKGRADRTEVQEDLRRWAAAARDLAAQESHASPDLAAALGDLESEIRDVTVQIAKCRSPKSPCPFCEREVTRAMNAIDIYARDVAEHERTREPQPAPELAAYEADTASLADQRNRVSETADQLRAQVRNLRDALERCRDAAGRSPAAVHTIASQALASSPLPGGDL